MKQRSVQALMWCLNRDGVPTGSRVKLVRDAASNYRVAGNQAKILVFKCQY